MIAMSRYNERRAHWQQWYNRWLPLRLISADINIDHLTRLSPYLTNIDIDRMFTIIPYLPLLYHMIDQHDCTCSYDC